MQDWEWEIADATRVGEFLDVYESGTLSEDERFSLMEIILQSVEESPGSLDLNKEWLRTLRLLDENFVTHRYSIWYWANPSAKDSDEQWRVTPSMRALLSR